MNFVNDCWVLSVCLAAFHFTSNLQWHFHLRLNQDKNVSPRQSHKTSYTDCSGDFSALEEDDSDCVAEVLLWSNDLVHMQRCGPLCGGCRWRCRDCTAFVRTWREVWRLLQGSGVLSRPTHTSYNGSGPLANFYSPCKMVIPLGDPSFHEVNYEPPSSCISRQGTVSDVFTSCEKGHPIYFNFMTSLSEFICILLVFWE